MGVRSARAAKMTAGLAALLWLGCADGDRRRADLFPTSKPWTPARGGAQQDDAVDLSGVVPEQATLVGVAVAPDGELFVLDSGSGLYHLGESGAVRVLDSSELDERYGLSSELELTDVVAYGLDRFLITAENDGFLLDLWAGTMQSYFCYLPPVRPEGSLGGDPAIPVSISQVLAASGIPVKQRTESVAVSDVSGAIFAQPQTLLLDAEQLATRQPLDPGAAIDPIAGAELFVFQSAGGQPSRVEWMEPHFLAGGMVAREDRLFLGFRDALFELTADSLMLRVSDLPLGTVVTGMAIDIDGALLVLDGPGRRLLRLPSVLP
jgi:hypothetical protein